LRNAKAHPMKHSVRVIAVPKDPPDLDQFVAALLALAVARLADERQQDTPEQQREADRE
jgi:hypothetical protein